MSTPETNPAITGVLLLRPPPPQWDSTLWHRQTVTGVPFLLRNLLHLHRGGLSKITVHCNPENTIAETFRQQLHNDPRLTLDLHWISDLRQLNVSEGAILLLDGSVLYDKLQIRDVIAAIQSGSPENIPSALQLSQMPTESTGDLISVIQRCRQASDKNSRAPIVFFPGDENARIRQEADRHIQDKRLLKTCGLSNDSLMDRLVTRSISRHLTRMFLATPLTPNQITIFSLMLGLISAWCFSQGNRMMDLSASALLLLSAWIDCTDGEIARLKCMESKLGGQLDILSDNLVHFAVFFGIGMGLYHSTGNSLHILAGGFAVLGSLISFVLLSSSVIQKKSQANAGGSQNKNFADQLANRDFIYFLFIMAVIGRLDIFLTLTAVGANVFALYLMYKKSRSA